MPSTPLSEFERFATKLRQEFHPDGTEEQTGGDPSNPRVRDEAAGGPEDDQEEHAGEEQGADGQQGLRHLAEARSHRGSCQKDEQGLCAAACHGVHPEPLRLT